MIESQFDALLLEAIDKALSSLGESIMQIIYFHLEKSFHVKREEIPDRLGAFTQAVENIFGVGADVLEVLIANKLYEEIGEVFDRNESIRFSFAECVTAAQNCFQQKNRIKTIEELAE